MDSNGLVPNIYLSPGLMTLPDCVLHSIDYFTQTEDADAIFQQIGKVLLRSFFSDRLNTKLGAMVVDPQALSRHAEDREDILPQISALLHITAEELCRLDGSQARRSIISSLLSVLGSTLSRQIWTMCVNLLLRIFLEIDGLSNSIHSLSVDSPFLLPRLKELCDSADVMDGHALMLALLSFNNTEIILDEEQAIDPCFTQYKPFVESSVDRNGELSHISSDSNDQGDETASQAHALAISFPPDAHVFLNRSPGGVLEVPLFVVAESTNIKYLMISVLYQRFVLSIDEPLIGVEVCDNSSVVHVHFGWLDPTAKVVSASYFWCP